MKKMLLGVVICVLALMMAEVGTAHAGTRVRWNVDAVQCYHYSVTEFRGGVFGNDLWRLQQQVYWCETGTNVWKGPSVLRSHWENLTWNFGGYTQTYRKKLYAPVRWQFYVKAQFDGNGAYLITPHDHPWVRMTIWQNNPTHVAYSAGCGC